jgi:hypothetical protein
MTKKKFLFSDYKNSKIGWGQIGWGKKFFFSTDFDQTVVLDEKNFFIFRL